MLCFLIFYTVDLNLPPKLWKVEFQGLIDEPLTGLRSSKWFQFMPNGHAPFTEICEGCWGLTRTSTLVDDDDLTMGEQAFEEDDFEPPASIDTTIDNLTQSRIGLD
jgi:hypothetical protein